MSDTETTEAAPTRREALEAAFEAAEAPDTPPAETATPEPAIASDKANATTAEPVAWNEARPATDKARDDKGRFQRATNRVPKPKVGAPTTTAPPTPAAASATPAPDKGAATTTPAPKAPASWKAGAREKWAALPPEVQQETLRRERETQAALSEATQARRNWDAYQQVVAPYVGMIAAEGGNPISAAQNLFQTAAVLRTGAPGDKAQLVAGLIQRFGIDINMLAAALDGHGPRGQGAQQQPSQQFRDPRFDAFMQQMEAQKQQREAAMAQQTGQEVEEFLSASEFGEDVRQDMADMLEVAARRGVALSLEDAYTRAVKLHPEVSGVLEQREKASQANALAASTQRARVAAVSLKSRPSGPSSGPAPTGRRAQLDAAWEQHNR